MLPILALRFDMSLGFPVFAGAWVEWREPNWLDVLMGVGAITLII